MEMSKLEKVIKEWEAVLSRDPLDAPWDLIDDTLALLKEQEPKLVRIDEDSVHCPSCGNELFTYPRQKFCDECGQAVKWDG